MKRHLMAALILGGLLVVGSLLLLRFMFRPAAPPVKEQPPALAPGELIFGGPEHEEAAREATAPAPAPGPGSAPAPAPGPGQAAPAPAPSDPFAGAGYRIRIPGIGVDAAVQGGIEDAQLARGPGHYVQTPRPGEAGNAAIAGHRTVRGRPSFFHDIDKLKAGDTILVQYPGQTYTFTVERVFITDPYDLSVLDPTPYPSLTLTTCDPPGTDENRLIVRARLTDAGR